MAKFIIPPNQEGYSVSDGVEVLRQQLDGGKSKYRLDILNSASTVNVTWNFNPEEYKYFRAFYKGVTLSGALPFTIDLYVDDSILTEHTAHFIPGTVQLVRQTGLTFIVSCQLEIQPIEQNLSQLADYAILYSEFGNDWRNDFPEFENDLNTIINIDLPDDIN